MSRLLILEGPDGAGKSTLARELQEALGATLEHHGPYPHLGPGELAPVYLEAVGAAVSRLLEDPTSPPHILDRAWQSEPIYAAVHRQSLSRLTPGEKRALERVAMVASPVVIYCLPPWETVEASFRKRKAQELLADTSVLAQVYDRYTAIAEELHDETFAEEEGLPSLVYDWTRTNAFANLLDTLDAMPRNEGPGAGRFRPERSLLLVGDRANVSGLGERDAWLHYRAPFTSLSKGCSPWLNAALEGFSIPEFALYWINATDPRGAWTDGNFIKKLRPAATVALGAHAASWCARWVTPLGAQRVYRIPHPQYWKRFKAREQYPLINILLKELTK